MNYEDDNSHRRNVGEKNKYGIKYIFDKPTMFLLFFVRISALRLTQLHSRNMPCSSGVHWS